MRSRAVALIRHCTGVVSAVLFAGGVVSGCDSTDSFDPDAVLADALIAGHDATAALESIPTSVLDYIRDNYRIFYGHTSHGSQIVTGLNMLAAESGEYALTQFHEVGDDLGQKR